MVAAWFDAIAASSWLRDCAPAFKSPTEGTCRELVCDSNFICVVSVAVSPIKSVSWSSCSIHKCVCVCGCVCVCVCAYISPNFRKR